MRNVSPHAARRTSVLGAVLLGFTLPAWWLDRSAFLGAWLVAWLFGLGVIMGGLANVWIHQLTGGAWGQAIRRPLLDLGRALPWLSLLFLPVLGDLSRLYPWAGAGGWAGALAAPEFKTAWLQPGSFVFRAVLLLLLWNGLAWGSRRPAWGETRPFAALALILYGFSASVAAVDWIMSLSPLWYSSVFGLVVGVGQVLSGLAYAVWRQARAVDAGTRRDLGNLLLAYVMTWAYLAFAQYLIIWSENLPHEISWYLARREGGWPVLGLAVVLLQFALPFLLLLFRSVKESARRFQGLGAGLLAAHFFNMCWLVLPSFSGRLDLRHLLFCLPPTVLGLAAVAYGLAHPREVQHA